jgi:gamma-glutamyltranspeptidase/glutathione hydrolase
MIDFRMSVEEAVHAPRVHFEGDLLQLEEGIKAETADELARLYEVNRWTERSMFFGGVHAVARQGADWAAAGDPRRGGYTVRVP